jgi:hypothetical protein
MKEWFKSIDPRILFGFAVLSVVCLLAVVIALGKVHQESSFGLDVVLGCLTTMAGGFTVWAFSNMKDKS